MSFEVGLYLNVRILLLLAVLKVEEIESHEQRQQKERRSPLLLTYKYQHRKSLSYFVR
ncbi:TPA: hypothetical protein I7264_18235 [Vibrio parahaemolyticus]|nr:hypothetical protein [Vibrio parahaemolyticus]EGQ9151421.1 hypothetical protein [Vibrio parahaemolyticus]EGQ9886284.1 hypothetical protein [Vibrio parahaemolyticus]EGR1282702.1 hypothetical protein [Vibrio parahaemolyticus]EGR1792032.1 hypothetical protein [Vibrio parahaemolyticus]